MRHLIRFFGLVLLVATVAVGAAEATGPRAEQRVLGDPDAPVTLIEFSSLTCPHCATFHVETLPRIKAAYVDTGKVRLVYHDFPLDPLALAAAMTARCVPPERYFGFLEMLYANQAQWARSQDPLRELEQMGRLAGLSPTGLRECLNDQALLNTIRSRQAEAERQHDITSTPSFVINGSKLVGAQPFERFEQAIEQALAAAPSVDPATLRETTPDRARPDASAGASRPTTTSWWSALTAWWQGGTPR
ncbi:MAG: DsbA family protein [Rhodospirillales bacterium]|nr:MAG: DsbA family protein [Rhodospirillales bacterium]